jgi:hypothetical protein
MRSIFTSRRFGALPFLGAPLLISGAAQAQFVFSTDYTGVSISIPDSFGAIPITEGDLLTPALGALALGPLPTPGIDISGGATGLGLALHAGCVGHPPVTPCGVELDAVSYGVDRRADGGLGFGPGEIWFSTHAFATGFPSFPPDLSTEAPCFDSAADLMASVLPMPPGPHPPFAAFCGNTGVVDGDGLTGVCPSVYPGTGLLEPSFPFLPPLGDNLDAVNIDGPPVPGGTGFPATGVYFSLDGVIAHPYTGVPSTGSALAHGFFGADILHSAAPGGPPVLWAAAPTLGLNIAGALDDLDARALWETGTGVFEPSLFPYDWMGGTTDMVLFSVRAGSPVIGLPDSIFGLPIEEGDILTTPLAGGFSPFPGIFIAAENLGLVTMRTFGGPADDLNALDLLSGPLTDCNGNGVEDMIDINTFVSSDVNGNFVPDECEIIGGPLCYCPAAVAPCANPYLPGGCRNSTGVGAILGASGSGSVGLDNLVLTATQLPLNKPGLFFGGTVPGGPFPFGDGLRCVTGMLKRFTPVLNSGGSGTLVGGPGLATANGVLAGQTWDFQAWYRDPAGPCGSGFNTSNAYSVLFTL